MARKIPLHGKELHTVFKNQICTENGSSGRLETATFRPLWAPTSASRTSCFCVCTDSCKHPSERLKACISHLWHQQELPERLALHNSPNPGLESFYCHNICMDAQGRFDVIPPGGTGCRVKIIPG